MSSEWHEYKFGELCDISRGASPRPIKDFIADLGMPWVKIADATSSESKFISTTKEKIKPEGVPKSVTVYPGDLILSNSATPGLPRFMKIEACIHDGWMLLKNFRRLDKEFAFWLLLHERKNLVAQGNGSVFTNLKTDILRNHRVRIPPLEEQHSIAVLLNSLSDKIQLNSETNQTLEQMAQAIFKNWFVDFEPVKAKIDALEAGGSEEDALLAVMQALSGKDAAALARLQTEKPEQYAELRSTAVLFPSTMQDSDLGEIPDGWIVSNIGDEVTVVGGGTPSTKDLAFWNEGKFHWTTPKDLSRLEDKVLISTERRITEAGLAKISSGLLPIDTVLMSSRAPVGYLALAKIPVAINQGFIAMKCDKALIPEFVLQWCNAHMNEIKSRASGTTFAEISKKNFKIIPLVIPPKILVDNYSNRVRAVYLQIENNMKEVRFLEELRDNLIPKLLSGSLSVTQPCSEAK